MSLHDDLVTWFFIRQIMAMHMATATVTITRPLSPSSLHPPQLTTLPSRNPLHVTQTLQHCRHRTQLYMQQKNLRRYRHFPFLRLTVITLRLVYSVLKARGHGVELVNALERQGPAAPSTQRKCERRSHKRRMTLEDNHGLGLLQLQVLALVLAGSIRPSLGLVEDALTLRTLGEILSGTG